MPPWIDPFLNRLLSGAGLVPACEGRGPVVLMYHSITRGRKSPPDRWGVSEENFKKQLCLLRSKGWTTLCVRDLLKADPLPPRTVLITFDDGFADNYERGFKLLDAYGMRGTFFIVSGKTGAPDRLSAAQAGEMASSGMEIGAHTRTHARLPELDAARIGEEVTGSKKDIEDMLGLPVTSFAYPYGLFNDTCVEAVRKAGFKVACTTRTGWFGSESDLLRVRRVAVFSFDSLSTFARKVAFAGTDVRWRSMAGYFVDRIRSRIAGNGTR
ncbi:MAG: polysaccharide deacetylase family protein [Nitrospirae bacterium]|nr:polysaccharide deacetylase family protein [Nitrospirota bacterium]